MTILKSIRSTNMFLVIYTSAILSIFAVSSAAMRFAHEKVGAGPYTIGLIFFRLMPLLMWSIPLVMALLGGRAFGEHGFRKLTLPTRTLAAVLIGILYFAVGTILIFGT